MIQMACAVRLLQLIRVSSPVNSTCRFSSSLSTSKFAGHVKIERVHQWSKGFELFLCRQRRNFLRNFTFSGRKLITGSVCGSLVAFTSISFGPQVSYAMNGLDILVDDYSPQSGPSDPQAEVQKLLSFLKKIWIPLLCLITVLTNMDRPVSLAVEVLLLLLTTKPRPHSVYLFIDKLCQQYKRREHHFYRYRCYAKKVEVDDYKLICVAKVQIGDQDRTLIGLLNGWWILPSLDAVLQRASSLLRGSAIRC